MVSRSSIGEANKHLKALHSRVQQLEKTVQDQHEILADKDDEFKEKLLAVCEVKDTEITELTAKLLEAKAQLATFENLLKDKDKTIGKLQERCQVLDSVMSYQPALESLLTTLASGGCLSDSGISASEMPADEHAYHSGKSCVYRGSAIRRMAKNFSSHAGRRKQFSISEDDDEDQNADTEGESSDERTSNNRELYL